MWDVVYGWLLTHLSTLSGLSGAVFDGLPLSHDQLLGYATVGDEDPAGDYSQESDPIDTLTRETGAVVVKFVARSGDDDLSVHRVTTKAWVDRLRRDLAADMTLGGLLMQGSTVYLGRTEVRQQKTSGGVYVERAVSVQYETRL